MVRALALMGYCDTPSTPACSDYCVCGVMQLAGADERRCQQEPDALGVSGWCYVAPEQGLGEWAEVANCPADQQQALRVTANWQSPEQILMLACRN